MQAVVGDVADPSRVAVATPRLVMSTPSNST